MSRKAPRPQSRRHIFVFDQDWETLSEAGKGLGLGPGTLTREVLAKVCKGLRAREEKILDGEEETTDGG